jgi:hypothetical protein
VWANESALYYLERDEGFKEAEVKFAINGFRWGGRRGRQRGREGGTPAARTPAPTPATPPNLPPNPRPNPPNESAPRPAPRSFCNLPGLQAAQGERVRLYAMALGSSEGFHTLSSQAASLDLGASRAQAVPVMPGMMRSVDLLPQLPGQWLLQCQVQAHAEAGMAALLDVADAGVALGAASGRTRTYYISADEVQWDYAPQGKDLCSGFSFSDEQKVRCWMAWGRCCCGCCCCWPGYFDACQATSTPQSSRSTRPWHTPQRALPTAPTPSSPPHLARPMHPTRRRLQVYVENSESTIGAVYKKAVYRQYTSAAFATLAPRPPTQGLLGPTLHAEAGDKLVVVLRNALSLNTSLAVGGGLLPASASARDVVLQPNETYTYEWVVPASAAPGPQDPSTVAYTYCSGVDTAAQLNAGLMGALVVGARGSLGANDLPKGAPAAACPPASLLLPPLLPAPPAARLQRSGCSAPTGSAGRQPRR